MLNELYDAALRLSDASIPVKKWDKEYVLVRKPKLTFFVYFDQLGAIADIERVNDLQEAAELRTWESKGGLRQSFPYFNIPPLRWIGFDPETDREDKDIERAIRGNKLTGDQLSRWLEKVMAAESTKKWDDTAHKKLGSCLEKGRALKDVLGAAPEASQSIVELIGRVTVVSEETFYDQLYNAFINKLRGNPGEAGKYFEGLFYWSEKKPGNAVTLLLELAEGVSRFEFPVRHEKVRDWMNGRLLSQHAAQKKSSSSRDIFGNDSAGCGEAFDDVRMRNALGVVKLRSMASAAECQYRYRKAEAQACPVGQESRSRMKGALEWLTDSNREGKTWAAVSRAADNKEILLAYPSVLPPEPPQMATVFGGHSESQAGHASRFEDCAHNVTVALRGLMARNPDLDIRVFVLRKMDVARTRVSSHRRYSAQRLIDAAGQWQKGCRNLPRILIKQFVREALTEWLEPKTPFPMDVVWVLNTVWSRDGQSAEGVKNLPAEDGISLLLEEGVSLQPVLRRALHGAAQNAVGLVLGLGQAHALGEVLSTPKKYARQPMILPSILGFLLLKLNITTEEYMKSAPYLIGRLLSLADQLHYHYCVHVRNKPHTPPGKLSIPPQLMGNALMPTALEEPVKAMALYCNRILPYHAWARTVSSKEAAGLARHFLSELGKVCDDLKMVPPSDMPKRCSDPDKAQMLVGYLARQEKSDSGTT